MEPATTAALISAFGPILAQMAAQGIGSAGQWAYNKYQGPQAANQEDQLHNWLRSQLMSEGPGQDFGPIRDDITRHWQEQILPQLQQGMSSAGAERSSGYGLAQRQSSLDLASRLGSLQSQFEQQKEQNRLHRLGGLGGYLGQQQNYGLGRGQLRQRGAMFQQELPLRNLQALNQAYSQTGVPVGSIYHSSQPGAAESVVGGVSNIAQAVRRK